VAQVPTAFAVWMQLPLSAIGVAKEHETEIFKITTLTVKYTKCTIRKIEWTSELTFFPAGAVSPYNEEMISRERLDRNSAVIGGNSTLLSH